MAKQLIKNYSFNAGAKTVTLTDFGTVALERLALITDTTLNQIVYNFADNSVATASVSGNVITLSTVPGGAANGDKLRIDYEDATGDPVYDTPPLPNGAATAANQTTANTSLASLDTKQPAKGAATTANSSPVNIASDQTVPVSGTITTTPSGTQTVSGTVTANAGTNLNTSALALDATLTGGTQKTKIVDSGGTNAASVDVNGAIAIQSGGSTGSAVPIRAVQMGGSDGTLLRAVKVSSTGVVSVDGSAVTQPVSGTVTTTPSGTQTVSGTVTANAGTNLNTSALALDATLTGGTQKTKLVDTGGTNVATVSAGGALKVDGSAVTQPISGTITTGYSDTAPATQNVTIQDTSSSTASGANSQSIITGTPTANSAASFTIAGIDTIKLQVTGTWTGTLQSEISLDSGTTWYVTGIHQTGTNYTVASWTANFAGGGNVSAATNFRIRATAAMTGTATVKVVESINTNSVYLANTPQLADGTTPTQKLAINGSGQVTISNSAFTANAGTNLNTSALALDATLTGGTQKTKLVDSGGTNVASIDSSGALAIQSGGSTGSAVPIRAVQMGGSDGTNLRAVKVSSTGVVSVDGSAVTQPVSGTVSITANSAINNAQVSGTAVSVNNGTTDAGTQRVTLSSDSTGQVKLATGANTIGALTANQSVNTTQLAGTAVDVNSGNKSAGTQRMVIATDQPNLTTALNVGAAQTGTWTVQPGNTANSTAWLVQSTAATTGGATPYHLLSAATTNATSVKGSAGMVYSVVVTNTNAAERFLKFFDKATAPTVGTDVPVWTLQIPGNTSGAGMVISLPVGLKFTSGISFAITGAAADNDATAISANDVIVNLAYA